MTDNFKIFNCEKINCFLWPVLYSSFILHTGEPNEEKRSNILLINIDDMGWRDVGFMGRPGSAIRYGNWKLIQYFENNDNEMCNLKDDKSEENNLIENNPEKRDELLEMLEDWRKKTNAPVPTELNPEYAGN